ncbi:MarR family transcriptional regulator [Natronolimnohabitans sp. A-GB9]|uniref:MarR family transcriptional regulator n=1 Tax=Natronolimnohabitans sp. A-GB9 TaxID=3069757 RepID=UPI0027B345F1|nr:MarR family transcriptional regulator [Natronolimnohabitans sp. A-GB9]MDQ2050913.1 MarR family transcriptional regulator [Natronolimnohabitans sp. A-GB9]
MMEQTQTDTAIRQLPTEINSPQGKLVYLCLEATGGATAEELGDLLALKKITILSICTSLSSQDLVESDDGTYVLSN